ncbi:HPr family phosphocarrier protein [Arthrobacter sp. zg-Y20]|uniref:HPr family phosphocarrier protein n=1 Tax=unclassified Arthrobacter TaxID=235627 RepID=UPI001D15348F|nr:MULTISPECIES: HPr family phosphocarrier protein [unclassified Arthrobacter]MCC3276240.1 HPr family phosphocarrier protein [Arthrobacter sp. zg-Y20]MDK1316400.1 HPr family phosphocarrier protein [Arthrobacter sp. zg.Y20]WIB06446.1 HPr family phosphocarrier protein [Arthrobacter sp. zg-Y20]
MAERIATIATKVGLHARPATIFVEAVGEFDFDITIARADDPASEAVDAASILSLMALGAGYGEEVVLRAENPDADEALERLVRLLETDLDAD